MSICLRDICYRPGDNRADALLFDGLNLSMAQGEVVAITGPSGAGKTTLLSLVSLMVPPQSGTVEIADVVASALPALERQRFRQQEIGMIFQTARVFANMTVAEQIQFAYQSGRSQFDADEMLEMLDELNLTHRLGALPKELSGGERTRVATLISLVKQPAILLADEPTAALDHRNTKILLKILRNHAARHKMTIAMVTHDPQAMDVCDQTFELSKR